MSSLETSHPLPEPLVELVSQRFRVLGEPMRIRLLDRLRDGDATVGELQHSLGASQQNVSKHLGILHAAGMVSRTKDGNHTRSRSATPPSSSSVTASAAACAASSPSSKRSCNRAGDAAP
ncbi:MAG: ArsR/SmtB family transcription factor [Solirubrobacteraceae bacterium]